MNRLRRCFPYLAPAILLCGVVFLARSFFYAALVDPAARILWLFIRLARVVDQEAAWTLLILAAVIFGLPILLGSRKDGLHPHPPGRVKRSGRAAFWEAQFRSADTEAAHRLALQRSLERLASAVDELVESDEALEINLPARKSDPFRYVIGEARRLWRAAVGSGRLQDLSLLRGRGSVRLFRGEEREKRENFLDRELEREVDRSLGFLEDLMEMHNDGLPGSSGHS